jgi:1,2-diacylglycerol 3-beta-glucosyltransferase
MFLVATAVSVLALAASLWHALLTLFGYSRTIHSTTATKTAVVIPAHNEETGLPRTLRSLANDHLTIIVVADNCTDRTAAVARAAGATVVERTDADRRGKGYALAAGIPVAVAMDVDSIIILDADCELAPGSISAYGAILATCDAAQGAVLSRAGSDAGSAVAAVGSWLDSRAGAAWDRLGQSAPLRGTGMAFRKALLERLPWTAAGLAEDAEYFEVLMQHRIRIRYAHGAAVLCDAPPTLAGLAGQRRRWSAGLAVGRFGILRRPFQSKPLVLLLTIASLILSVLSLNIIMITLSLIAIIVFAAVLLVAVSVVGVRSRTLVQAPFVVVRLLLVTLSGFIARSKSWQRAERSSVRIAV